MNTPRTMAAGGRRGAVTWPGCQRGWGAWGAMGMALALSGAAWMEGRAAEVVRPVAAPTAAPVAPVVAVPATATPVPPVAGTTTNQPGSVSVPLGDPVMVEPAVEVLQDMAARERLQRINRRTQEAMDRATQRAAETRAAAQRAAQAQQMAIKAGRGAAGQSTSAGEGA